MSEQLLMRLSKWNSSREMYSPIRRHITIKTSSAFDSWSLSGVEEREKIIKEEGCKEEDRQEV